MTKKFWFKNYEYKIMNMKGKEIMLKNFIRSAIGENYGQMGSIFGNLSSYL